MIAEGTAERTRIQKVLKDSNLKLGDVLSDLFGRSGQELLEGQATFAEIAELARRRLRLRIPAIIESIEGHSLRDHHQFQLKQVFAHLQFLEKQVDGDRRGNSVQTAGL